MDINSVILITGVDGLVGSALYQYLKSIGYNNTVGIGRAACNLLDYFQTKDSFKKISPDYVFHCAARVYGIMGNMNNKGQSFYENSMINSNVIESARFCNVKKITVMGTGAVYPYPAPGLPLKEDMIFMGLPHKSEDSYAHSKRAMLAMLMAYEESYQMDWAFVVSCNLFGPNDKFDIVNGHVVPSLIKKFHDAKVNNTNVIVWGDGSAKRDFMYVKDAVVAVVKIMKELNGPVNIGSGKIYSIGNIAEIISQLTNLADKVKWDPAMPNGQDYRGYDLTKLDTTGFQCRFEIKDALRETLDWYEGFISEG